MKGEEHVFLNEERLTEDSRTILTAVLSKCANNSVQNIVLHGYSLGAPIAAHLSKNFRANDEPYKAIVLDRPMTSFLEAVSSNVPYQLGNIVGPLIGFLSDIGSFSIREYLQQSSSSPIVVIFDDGVLGSSQKKLVEEMMSWKIPAFSAFGPVKVGTGNCQLDQDPHFCHEDAVSIAQSYLENL
eukprot:TRINITY_DN4361_c0_g1_i3.p1 TRINITY_DN4361_c0_g1~~TRINITY_DN4361_c0_g1_i3.p1  ORF type:complete len:184 (-),score=13.81 TRINITY_DN4361_c0_g1_i3:99-650(-)